MSIDNINKNNYNVNKNNRLNISSPVYFKNNLNLCKISFKGDSFEKLQDNYVEKPSLFKKVFIETPGMLCGYIPEFEKKKFQQVKFVEAKTLDEAIQFGKDYFGIKNYSGFEERDLDVVNWINEGLTKVNNETKGGKIAIPKKIVFKDIDPKRIAEINGYGTINFNKSIINKLKNSVSEKTGKKLTLKQMYSIVEKEYENKKMHDVYSSTFSPILHEMGHYQHQANMGYLYNSISASTEDKTKNWHYIIPQDLAYKTQTENIIKVFNNSKDIAVKVSDYAATSPMEFVAECYAQMIDGKKLDDDVMELYKKLGGIVP